MNKLTITIPVPSLNNKVTRAVAVVPLTVVAKGKSLTNDVHPISGTRSKLSARKAAKLQARITAILIRIEDEPLLMEYWNAAQHAMTFAFGDDSPEANAAGIRVAVALDALFAHQEGGFTPEKDLFGDRCQELVKICGDQAEMTLTKDQRKQVEEAFSGVAGAVAMGFSVEQTLYAMTDG